MSNKLLFVLTAEFVAFTWNERALVVVVLATEDKRLSAQRCVEKSRTWSTS